MKAISLWQPWATLIAIGAKQYETRSWSTPYRGPIVIHAAKNTSSIHVCGIEPFKSALADAGLHGGLTIDLPLGMALCSADLTGCYHTERIREGLSEQELAFGDYNFGRWAWRLDNIRCFKNPVPLSGKQGLFDCFVPLVDLEAT